MRDDGEELARRLEDQPEIIFNKYWPSWIKVGGKALLTPKMKPKQKKPTSSFQFNLTGRHAGQWYRFSAGFGGGVIALIFYGEHGRMPSGKSDWADAFNIARELLGIKRDRQYSPEEIRDREERRDRERAERAERDRAAEVEKREHDVARTMSAQEVWNSSLPLVGSHAEAYLISRGIPPISEWPWDCSDTLRFHPSLDHELDRRAGRFPALVGAVLDPFNSLTSVWQVYLDRKKAEKAEISNNKIGRGPLNGGAVRIGGNSDRVGAAEGIETSIGLWVLEGFRKPVWATLSTSGMIGFEPPMFVNHVSIYPDGDSGLVSDKGVIFEPPGIKAARSLYQKVKSIGIGSNINEMTHLGDGLDLLATRNKNEKTKQAQYSGQPR